MSAIQPLLEHVIALNGSDLHVRDRCTPRVRRNGPLEEISGSAALDPHTLDAMLREIAPAGALDEFERTGDSRFVISLNGQWRVRVSLLKNHQGRSAVLRCIPNEIATLEQLGLPPVLAQQLQHRSGLVLISGATGAGTTTTVAALLKSVNTSQRRRILTLEHPIEYMHTPIQSMFIQRDVAPHHGEAGVAPHSGYDVVAMGPLHSKEKIVAALSAAEAGMLVIGTLHSHTVIKALEQLLNCFSSDMQPWIRTMLANTLRCLTAQTLVPRADGAGRCVANEILIATTGVTSAIREGYVSKLGTMIQSGGADGMITLDDALAKRVEAGMINAADAMQHAVDKSRFERMAAKPAQAAAAASATPAKA
ncbi:MAG TPA: ATPase, T2SS/T4P/T4SS family [Planctomycetota bacterium]|nr:ATPase, T2SS/T4P/T4SS family [Planctomycetota bacterium]